MPKSQSLGDLDNFEAWLLKSGTCDYGITTWINFGWWEWQSTWDQRFNTVEKAEIFGKAAARSARDKATEAADLFHEQYRYLDEPWFDEKATLDAVMASRAASSRAPTAATSELAATRDRFPGYHGQWSFRPNAKQAYGSANLGISGTDQDPSSLIMTGCWSAEVQKYGGVLILSGDPDGKPGIVMPSSGSAQAYPNFKIRGRFVSAFKARNDTASRRANRFISDEAVVRRTIVGGDTVLSIVTVHTLTLPRRATVQDTETVQFTRLNDSQMSWDCISVGPP